MSEELTDCQAEVLSVIARLIEQEGYPPTFREIARALGCSPKNAHEQVGRLKKKNYLTYEPGRARTFKLTAKGKEAVASEDYAD